MCDWQQLARGNGFHTIHVQQAPRAGPGHRGREGFQTYDRLLLCCRIPTRRQTLALLVNRNRLYFHLKYSVVANQLSSLSELFVLPSKLC